MPSAKAAAASGSAAASQGKRSSRKTATPSSGAPKKNALALGPKPTATAAQTKLAFAKRDGPLPPPAKKVKIEEPKIDVKGKARADELSPASIEETSLWSLRYRPSERADLAVHPRKVKDVEGWLRDAFTGPLSLKKLRRLLILTGPTGAGKTETIRQLAKSDELDIQLVEWSNESVNRVGDMISSGDGDYSSMSWRFRDFLSKSARFKTLDLTSNAQAQQPFSASPSSADRTGPQASSSTLAMKTSSRKLIILEDLPMLSHPPTLQFFQDLLATHLSQPITSDDDYTPICIILSEMNNVAGGLLEDGSGSDDRARRETDWMRPRRLLGDELAASSAWTEIKFNEVAPTLIVKALKATLEKAATEKAGGTGSKTKASKTVLPPDILDVIAADCAGDIRSAVDTLQQVYTAYLREPSKFSELPQKKVKADQEASSRAVREVLNSLGIEGRQGHLDLFHALGKLSFSKRVGDPGEEEDDAPSTLNGDARVEVGLEPSHRQHLVRRQSKVDVNAMASSPLDTSVLQLFVHQNYPQYCTDLDQCQEIIDAFSFVESEIKIKTGDQYSSLPLVSHYSFLIDAHSTLLHLPSPVPRLGQRPVRPQFFDLFSSLTASQSRLDEIKKKMKWDLKSRSEILEEWLPMAVKMDQLASSSSSSSSNPRSSSLSQEMRKLAAFDLSSGSASRGVGRFVQDGDDMDVAASQIPDESSVAVNLAEVEEVAREAGQMGSEGDTIVDEAAAEGEAEEIEDIEDW